MIKGWRPVIVLRKAKVPRGGDGFENLIRSGVVFHNNRRVFVERGFPRSARGIGWIKVWGFTRNWHFDIKRVIR